MRYLVLALILTGCASDPIKDKDCYLQTARSGCEDGYQAYGPFKLLSSQWDSDLCCAGRSK